MTDRIVYRGDGYRNQRYVLQAALVDDEAAPLDLSNSTVYSTFRPDKVDPASDPTDAAAAMTCTITFDAGGAVSGTPTNFRLPAGGTAAEGILQIVADPDVTETLPLDTPLHFDIVVHKVGGDPITIESVWTLTAIDGYTHRG